MKLPVIILTLILINSFSFSHVTASTDTPEAKAIHDIQTLFQSTWGDCCKKRIIGPVTIILNQTNKNSREKLEEIRQFLPQNENALPMCARYLRKKILEILDRQEKPATISHY